MLVGANVAVMIALAVGAAVVAQLIAFNIPLRADMTRTGVNSLSESTEKLLRDLPANLRITSLYFETDREEADQPKYREAVRNLLALYESTNRTKITADAINPLKDHQKFQQLLSRVREKPAYKEGIAEYQARLDAFRNELNEKAQKVLQEELERTTPATAAIDRTAPPGALAQVNELVRRLIQELQVTREQVDTLTGAANPQLAAAVEELKSLYPKITRALKEIPKFTSAELARNPNLPEADAAVLRDAGSRYADLVAALEGETTKFGELQPLKVDELLAKLQPTGNPIVLETDDEAEVIEFSSLWPPVDGSMGRASFNKRAFKGEEVLTSAIVRATYKQQTAVIFVRYGGESMFAGGFMPNQPQAPYAQMKKQLEDVNFVVAEWDLKSKDTPPEIEPPATRTLYVVFKPESPAPDPMGRPSKEPPFGESHRATLMKAIGENGRAIFMAGWAPGPFGPIASTYEFSDYLKNNWGVTVDTQYLLIQTVNVKPGEYQVASREFHFMGEVAVLDHDIVRGAQARLLTLPGCAPLELASPPPMGVELWPLVEQPRKDGIWGIKNLQTYQEQMQSRGFLSLAAGDREGPYTLAVAGKKGEAKVVVISSRGFAEDAVAFSRALVPTAQGIAMVSTNPGNVMLLMNSLHWLNDNTQLLNIGKPIDAGLLSIKNPATVWRVQMLTIGAWPALALVFGVVAWVVRRR
jgi:hypothetical protein